MGLERMLKNIAKERTDEQIAIRKFAESFFGDDSDMKIEFEISDAAFAISKELMGIPRICCSEDFSLEQKKEILNYFELIAMGLETFESEHGILEIMLSKEQDKAEGQA